MIHRGLGLLITGLLAAPLLSAATFTVDSTGDEPDDDLSDGICHTASGTCTLRAAIEQANATAGADTIAFQISGSGVQTISPVSAFPALTDDAGVTIDGFTQPGSSPNTLAVGSDAVLLIEIDGSGVHSANGLEVIGIGATIRGLVINRFSAAGIAIIGGYGHHVTGCYLGTDPSGTQARGNYFGVNLYFSGAATAQPNLPSTATIGGYNPGERNVISGNASDAVYGVQAVAVFLRNNYIGVSSSGNAGLPNGGNGIACFGCALTIGGNDPFAPGSHYFNVVSGNAGTAIAMVYGAQNVIAGNLLGTDASGTSAIPNGSGIYLGYETAVVAEVNLISGNHFAAINLYQTSVSSFAFNRIGTDLSGTSPLGNGSGIRIDGHSVRNVIADSTIAYNAGPGIVVGTNPQAITTENSIYGNSIHDNRTMGIDLGGDGISPNNDCDAGRGPNLGQNFPVLTSVTSSASDTTITGTLNSVPNQTFYLEFFSNTACDTGGYGGGETFIGSTSVTTDANCNASFLVPLTLVPPGRFVTATAMDAAGNTSEFSACVIVGSTVVVGSTMPTSGPAAGAAGVLISGSNFQPGATAMIGGAPATNVLFDRTSQLIVDVPALPAGELHSVVVTNPDSSTAALPGGWFADFFDVPRAVPIHRFVEKLVRHQLTGGCGGGNYCPGDPVSRAQAAVFLLRAKNGPAYLPPPATGTIFGDVPASVFAAAWIEALAAAGVTSGCGGGNFCPDAPVTRAQVAVLLLRTEEGPAYTASSCGVNFSDVPCSSPFAPWIYELYNRGVAAGCGVGKYCPDDAVTRGQMAVFLAATFGLP